MPTTTQVHPGDLITAELMNELLLRLGVLEGKVGSGSGGVTVPNVVGQQLSVARATIISPTTQLSLGFVIDAAGAGVDLAAIENLGLIVINEVPPGGSKVSAGTPINLVVSSAGGGAAPQPKPGPKITGVNPQKIAAGLEIEIVGENFALSRFQNQVFFNGFQGPDPTSASNVTSLKVTVPKNIPNVPSGSNELVVDVKVITPDGEAELNDTLVVLAPLPGPDFVINSIIPASLQVNQDITITGSGFNATLVNNDIEFSKPGGAVTTASPKAQGSNPAAGTLVVTVPANIFGLASGSNTVNVVVRIKGTQKRTPAKAITVNLPIIDL